MTKGFTIECGARNSISVEQDGEFIFCLDNGMIYAEEMIFEIEKRTGMDFRDIPIKGNKDDFNGLRFFNGGWERDFWGEFPDEEEIESYVKLKYGIF